MIPQLIIRPFIARCMEHCVPMQTYHRPNQPHPIIIGSKLRLISCPTEGRRPSWPGHTLKHFAMTMMKIM